MGIWLLVHNPRAPVGGWGSGPPKIFCHGSSKTSFTPPPLKHKSYLLKIQLVFKNYYRLLKILSYSHTRTWINFNNDFKV